MTSEAEQETGSTVAGPNSNPEVNQRPQDERRQPFGDANNLYEIPRTRPEDPPYRNWWIDDEDRPDGER